MVGYNPRIYVVELAPMGHRYYRGAFNNFEQLPPKYTWRLIDFSKDEAIIYVDLTTEESTSKLYK